MPNLPSRASRVSSSSSLRHCVTTLRSLLRISWSMSHRPQPLRYRSLLLQLFDPTHHEVVQCEADDSNGFDGLLSPRKSDFLRRAGGIILRTVGSMHNVVPTFHCGVECLLDFI